MAADSKGYEDLSREIVSGLLEWRKPHPNATLAELEAQVQERLAELHARLLEELALASGRTEWDISQAPLCPACEQPLVARGKQRRLVQAIGGKEITLERIYGVCPTCGAGLFPHRTRELGLGAGHWPPLVEEWCVRLLTWMPFAQAAALLGDLKQVQVSEASALRKTEAAGAIWVQILALASRPVGSDAGRAASRASPIGAEWGWGDGALMRRGVGRASKR